MSSHPLLLKARGVGAPVVADLAALRRALVRAWVRQTSADPPHWSHANPAWGQCAVTALVVQDFFGGVLLRCETSGGSHYWNRLSSDQEVDLTRQQFGDGVTIDPGQPRAREYVLSFPATRERYELLRRGVGAELTRMGFGSPK